MIQETEYISRRNLVAKELEKNSVAVILSAKQQTRSNDTQYPYRQNSNFYYLSGFKEENSALVIIKKNKKTKSYLFVQKKDASLELWTGKRLGELKAKELFCLDDVFIIDTFDSKIKEWLKECKNLYFDFSMQDERIERLREMGSKLYEHKNIAHIIGALRLIKSEAEIMLIKKALSITKEAHHKAMKSARNLEYEFELQAEIEYIFKKNGAYSDAYTSIVACGNSANTLHYISNNKPLVNGELILIDAGCEYDYYASDITRTIPMNGKFTDAQAELYEMILDVEVKIISMVKAGVYRSYLQEQSEELLCKGLIKLGILKGSLKKLLKNKVYKKYYPHGIGHWMGLDVHDEAPYKNKKGKEIELMSGMVLTIEPAIYIDKDDNAVPKKFRGIGIRIEDDILVREKGCENLSSSIYKTIKDIENI